MASYSLVIDRSISQYDLYVTYFIDGYSDPETGEYFGNTSWTLNTYEVPGGLLGGIGGFASEGDTFFFALASGAAATTLTQYRFEFTAQNTFSGASDALTWNAFVAPESTIDEVIIGNSISDIILSGSGHDIIRALGGNDVIDTGEGNDLIDAGAGADEIDGGNGADIMAGGVGDDTYRVDTILDVVSERPGEGNDTIIAALNFTIAPNVERLVLSGASALVGTGDGAANRIEGNQFANTLLGLGGGDRLFGNEGDDSMIGGDGDDELNGGTGRDTMEGGAGADTYYVDFAQDKVVESAGGNRDLVIAVGGLSVYALSSHVEDLTTQGIGNFRGIGNDLDNTITGGKGNDVLEGRDGSDSLYGNDGNDILISGIGRDLLSGGNGIDTASYATSVGAVSISLGTNTFEGGDAEGDGALGIENLIGSAGNDFLGGNAIANRLSGGNGNDVIDGSGGNDTVLGGEGADTLGGGSGIDTLSYAGSTAGGVTVDLTVQLGTAHGGDAEGDELSGFENVTGSEGNDTITGDNHNNVLIGRAGNDLLEGGFGNDVLAGGAGADTIHGGVGIDAASYASDTIGVVAQLDTGFFVGGEAAGDVLIDIENLIGGSGADELVGDAGTNILNGGAGDDTIKGGQGNDTVIGGMGADTMDGGDSLDLLSYATSKSGVGVIMGNGAGTAYGGDGAGDTFTNFENVLGSTFGDFIQGDQFANHLHGNGGSDTLDGLGGHDMLTGGTQDDVFRYGPGGGHDTVVDFNEAPGSTELIELYLGPAFDTFAEVMAVAKSTGSVQQHTMFAFDANNSLTLLYVEKASLVADDFRF